MAGILQDLHINSCEDLAYDLSWFMAGIPQIPVKICTYDLAIHGWNLARSTHRFLSGSYHAWSTLVDKFRTDTHDIDIQLNKSVQVGKEVNVH